MLRFYYVILISLPWIIYYIVMAEHYVRNREQYDEEQCYHLAKRLVAQFQKNARIHTISYGKEHLPEDGGYVMYSNHQGKYDALGIISVHEKPCSVVMDEAKSHMILTDQFMKLLEGIRLSRTDYKQQVQSAKVIQNEVQNGKKYIYFPEGKYEHNGNALQEFRPGAFQCATKAKAPIVPVAIYDSHLPFEFNSLRKITTQVYFLPPIYYEEYEGKTTREISEMVKMQIEECLTYLEEKRSALGLNQEFYQS